MKTTSIKHEQNARAVRPRWLLPIVAVALICFFLGFVPGGQAMPIIGSWIAGWVFCFWVFRRFKIVRILITIAFILLAIGAFFIISAGQAAHLLYGN